MGIKYGHTYRVMIDDLERLRDKNEPRWKRGDTGKAVQTRLLGGFDVKLRMEGTGLYLHFYTHEIEECEGGSKRVG